MSSFRSLPRTKAAARSPSRSPHLAPSAMVSDDTDIVGSVNVDRLDAWQLEIGPGASPGDDEWILLGSGEENVTGEVLGRIVRGDFEEGVYTIRLTADGKVTKNLETKITFNIIDKPEGDANANAERHPRSGPRSAAAPAPDRHATLGLDPRRRQSTPAAGTDECASPTAATPHLAPAEQGETDPIPRS